MKFQIGLSQRAYGRHRGVSDKAVRKAIATGRIRDAVLPDGTIDAAMADRLWEQNTDPVQRRGKEALRGETSMAALMAAKAAPIVEPMATPIDAAMPAHDGDDGRPTPKPITPEMFEEDPPRRRHGEDDGAEVALLEHLATNRARRGESRPGDPDISEVAGPDVARMLQLAVEEKHEKVRKLRLANDEKEKSLVSAAAQEALLYAIVRASTEDWQVWPDVFGPELAAKWGIDQRELTQDIRDGVRARLLLQASKDAVKPADEDDEDDDA